MLLPSNQALGEATVSGTEWSLNWDTRNQPNGYFQVVAVAHFGTVTTSDCASAAMPVNITNNPTQAPTLAAVITPSTYQMMTGASAAFSLDTIYVDQYGRSSHVTPASVNWQSNVGTVAPNGGSSTVFRAGPLVAGGLLSANIVYAGISTQATAQLKITPSTTTSTINSTPAPTLAPKPSATPTASVAPTSTTVMTASEVSRLANMPTIFRPAQPTNSYPVVSLSTLSCVEKAAGAVRFAEISSGKSKPSAEERKAASGCFSGIEPVPAVLAPVAPAHINELPSTTDFVTVSGIKNRTITSKDGSKVNGLLLTGKGAPNSTIFIYIFSDPLVLRAETNKSGEWNYVLETPLQSGNHEVFAVAEKDSNNFVRTSAVPIAIAGAAPGGQAGSLVVERRWSAAQLAFAAGAAVMVIASIIAFFVVIRRRRAVPPQITQPTVASNEPQV
jgi:hypothetical protein